jgi:UDP-galactopyranose mutase
MEPATALPHPPSPFASFWMGGFEGADHVNGDGRALDMAAGTGHRATLEDDLAAAARLGLRAVRESIGWRLAEPAPRRYDLDRAAETATAARRQGVQVVWTLMHYGTPADVNLFDDAWVPRFADFAAAVAERLAPLHAQAPVYNPINEIGYLAWVVSSSDQMYPYRREDRAGSSEISGYEVKARLVRAAVAAMAAIRAVDARARFLHIEPVVHVAAPRDRPELADAAERIAAYQWQVWDLLAGTPGALDLIGVNHYHSGQWEVQTERRLAWHERDPRRRPLGALLGAVWQRYGRAMIVAETGHVGSGRAAWLDEVADEVRSSRAAGVPVLGICLYPLLDRFDWERPSHWHHSGLWDVTDPTAPHRRQLCASYAAALARWQRELPEPTSPDIRMQTLLVFSHLRWSFVFQRPQHLMTELARHYRIVYVEEPVHDAGPPRIERRAEGPRIEVLVPHTPVDAPGFHDDQIAVLKPLVESHLRARGIEPEIVWLYTPMALPMTDRLTPRVLIYDCMDELSAFDGAPRQLRERERALLGRADLVFTGGPSLYEAKRAFNPRVHCLPSAVDARHFAPRPAGHGDAEALAAAELQQALPRPRLGYFGVIDERMDLGLLDALATARPRWQIVMVGPVAKIDPARLPRRPNIHWLGMQPYERLPHLLAGWDVCLMPFALNEATRYISPTKTLEYLAGEKPVVSTAVADVVSLYGDLVRIARNVHEFVGACEAALASTPYQRGESLVRCATAVWRTSWQRHGERIHGLLELALADHPPARADHPPARAVEPAAQLAPAR